MRDAEAMATVVSRYREIVNFDYWRLRADVEQTDEALTAHELIYRADRDQEEGRLDPAKQNYDQGLAAWRKVLDKFPAAVTNETFGEDLIEVIQRYRKLLDLRDEKEERKATYTKDFILHDIVELYEKDAAGSRQ
jgi:tetratricopeptide (TPR) repeat protein